VKPTIAVIGGFLGAGKTTLILAAAGVLQRHGVRVAAVLNDRGDDLVDTHLVQAHCVHADQVAGGRFCCRRTPTPWSKARWTLKK
jgi:G3E family GTPase